MYCFAPGCNHDQAYYNCKFFRFPKESIDPRLYKMWKRACRRGDRNPTYNDRLCSCHFLDGNRENIPSKFAHNEKKLFIIPSPHKKRSRVKAPSAYSRLCTCHFVNGDTSKVPSIFNHDVVEHENFLSPEQKKRRRPRRKEQRNLPVESTVPEESDPPEDSFERAASPEPGPSVLNRSSSLTSRSALKKEAACLKEKKRSEPWQERTAASDSSMAKGGLISCCIPSCNSSRSRSLLNNAAIQSDAEAITFHRFPKNDERHSVWLKTCFGTNEWSNVVDVKKSLLLCSKHFTPDDFTETFAYGELLQYRKKRCLKVTAVPSVNLPYQSVSKSPRKPKLVTHKFERTVKTEYPANEPSIGFKSEAISVKLKKLREEGKQRILQLIKENEEIYKCPIHKVNSPTCSIENCVLRSKRKPFLLTGESPSSLDNDPDNDANGDTDGAVEKSSKPIKLDVYVKQEKQSEEYPLSKKKRISDPSVAEKETFEVLKVPNGQTILLKLLNKSSPPPQADGVDGDHSLPSDQQSQPNNNNQSLKKIKLSPIPIIKLVANAPREGPSQSSPHDALVSLQTKRAALKRQSSVDSDTTAAEGITNFVNSRNTSCDESIVKAPSTVELSSGAKSSFRLNKSALSEPTGRCSGQAVDPLVKLSKIRKIDRLISENNILIGKLSSLEGRTRKNSPATGGCVDKESLTGSGEQEPVERSLTTCNSNKENSQSNPTQIPPLVPIGSGSHNHSEQKILDQSALIDELLDRIAKLEDENRRLKCVEKENDFLKSIITQQRVVERTVGGVERSDSSEARHKDTSKASSCVDEHNEESGDAIRQEDNNEKDTDEETLSAYSDDDVDTGKSDRPTCKGTANSEKELLKNKNQIDGELIEKNHNIETIERDHSVETAEEYRSVETIEEDHSVETIERDHIVETIERDHTVETIERDHSSESIEEKHRVETIERDHSVETAEEDHSVETIEEDHSVEIIERDDIDETIERDHSVETIGKDQSVETIESDHLDHSNVQEYIVVQSCTKDGYTEVKVIRNEDYVKMNKSGEVESSIEADNELVTQEK